jgi:hypothetical protein
MPEGLASERHPNGCWPIRHHEEGCPTRRPLTGGLRCRWAPGYPSCIKARLLEPSLAGIAESQGVPVESKDSQ